MTLRLRLLLILSILAMCLAACAPAASTSPSAAGTVAASAPAYPVSLTDDAGRSVNLPGLPRRIVSLAPSNTEIVCALGACDRLVGVTDFDDYPAEVSDVAKVVIGAQVDVEKVVDANPQLILAAGNELTPSSVITQLADLGYPVLVLYPESLDELYADIELVGRAIDASTEAVDVVDGMRTRAQAVADAVASAEKPRTFYEVGVFQGTIYTAGADSFLSSLISIAGGDPITGDPRSTAIQLEDLVAADPQLILLGDAAYDESITPASVAARDGWKGMTAVIDGHIVVMAEDPVITRPGPRIIDGLEALAHAIHPELFS
ncbi:MAG TPA: ABC transporter substrate-binding protein [Candidatus Limnocylindria bacterium]|jgi:iron complex transport system substrate-binding protein